MDKQHPEITTEGQHGPAKPQNVPDTTARFVFTWRTKGLTADAKTLDDMITALEGAADALRLLKEAGVVLDAGKTAGDDTCLVTTDPAVAQQFGFQHEATAQATPDEGSSR